MERYNFLIDSHCHLNRCEENAFYILEELIINASKNNVRLLHNICTERNDIPFLLKAMENYDNIYSSIGLHPENVDDEGFTVAELLKYTENYEKIISIGEVGLDYHYGIGNIPRQKENFETHIEAARQSKLPLVIHSRDADEDMIDMLKSEMKNGEFQFVLHCFCSGEKLAYTGLDLGGLISLSGIVTFKNSRELQEIAKKIPLDRMLLETDAPFLAPVPLRGKTNQPANVKYVAEFLSGLLNVEYDEIAMKTTENFLNYFKRCSIEFINKKSKNYV